MLSAIGNFSSAKPVLLPPVPDFPLEHHQSFSELQLAPIWNPRTCFEFLSPKPLFILLFKSKTSYNSSISAFDHCCYSVFLLPSLSNALQEEPPYGLFLSLALFRKYKPPFFNFCHSIHFCAVNTLLQKHFNFVLLMLYYMKLCNLHLMI